MFLETDDNGDGVRCDDYDGVVRCGYDDDSVVRCGYDDDDDDDARCGCGDDDVVNDDDDGVVRCGDDDAMVGCLSQLTSLSLHDERSEDVDNESSD